MKISPLEPWFQEQAEARPFGYIVWKDGKVVEEAYGNGFGPDNRFEIGSLRKSFHSAWVGRLLHDGLISLEQNAYEVWPELVQLSGNGKDKLITLHHLMSGTSGWLTPAPPGREFLYNNAAFTAAERVTARKLQLERDEIAPEIEQAFQPAINANSWAFCHSKRPFEPPKRSAGPKLAVHSNMPDLLKWGQLWLNGGMWNGEPLIPASYVRLATSRVNPHVAGAHYGYNWFINDDGTLWPDAPKDAFGHSGNGSFLDSFGKSQCFLWICPSKRLVAASIVGTPRESPQLFSAISPQAKEWTARLANQY